MCKGNEKVIGRKLNYILFPIDFYYGVTVDGTCENTRYSCHFVIYKLNEIG